MAELIIEKQDPAMLKEVENHGFFATVPRAIKPNRKHLESSNDVNEDSLFQCPEQGCCCEFANSEELQDHVHLGEHNMVAAPGSLYDSLRHD